MTIENRLRAYIEHVEEGGDPSAPGYPVADCEHEIWVSWRTDEDGSSRLEVRVDDERYGCFVDGRRVEPSWEGGVRVPDVDEWEGVRKL